MDDEVYIKRRSRTAPDKAHAVEAAPSEARMDSRENAHKEQLAQRSQSVAHVARRQRAQPAPVPRRKAAHAQTVPAPKREGVHSQPFTAKRREVANVHTPARVKQRAQRRPAAKESQRAEYAPARTKSPAYTRRTNHTAADMNADFNPLRSNFVRMRDLLIPVIGIAAALIIAIIVSYVRSGNDTVAGGDLNAYAAAADCPIRINEVVTSNSGSHRAPDGEACDWIELINTSDSAQSLYGYFLTDKADSDKLYSLPAITLEAGECAIVYANDKGVSDPSQPMQANFKLSSSGETLYLINDSGQVCDHVEIPALKSGTSYARDVQTGEWVITSDITPGLINTAENASAALTQDENSDIVISEVQPVNCSIVYDADGDASDWIEITNRGSNQVNLKGWALSDDTAKPMKWLLPDITLSPGEYLIVFASGKNRTSDELHTNFALASDGGSVILSNASGSVMSYITYGEARADASYAPNGDGAQELLCPTPGAANDDADVLNAVLSRRAVNTYRVYIQEVGASVSEKTDANPNGYDFIELYNAGDTTIDLSGMGLSDNPKSPRKWQFPDGSEIQSGQYLIVFCSGRDKSEPDENEYETNFRLSSIGCTVTLSTADGTIIDECAFSQQYSDVSYGYVDDSVGYMYLSTPTPGGANSGESYKGKLSDVEFSTAGGLMTESVSLALTCEDGASIYYTTDSSTPTQSSTLYTGAIEISDTTIIRAAAYKDGYLCSYTVTQSYFYGLDHQLPVVSLVSDDKYLFDWETGLLVKGPNATEEEPYGSDGHGANFWMGWEYPANVEYFDENGVSKGSERIGIKIIGQDSRAQDQKGIAMYAKSRYGNSAIDFNPFPQLDFTSYKSLTLRPSGEDAQYTHLRDATLTSLASGTNAMYQAAAPCVLYINGQCWGVYNLRERINEYYIAQHEGITQKSIIEDIDLIKGNAQVLNGSYSDYEDLLEYVSSHDLSDEENLKYVTDRIDIENYIDYVLCEVLLGNTDSGNIKFYQSSEAGVKWKWILFDLDWAMYTMDINYFTRYTNPEGHGVHSAFDNTIIRGLLENDDVKDYFLKRMAELMQGTFSTDNIISVIENYKESIYYDMQYQFAKWGGSYERWEKYVDRLENNVRKYASNALKGVKECFDLSSAEMTEYFGQIEFTDSDDD